MADQLLENSVGWWKLVSSIDFTGSEFFKRCNKTFLENNLLVLKIDSLLALLFVFYKGNLLSTKDLNKINRSSESESRKENPQKPFWHI